MKARDFCFWLQGYFELESKQSINPELTSAQINTIKQHLNLVFKHEIDPSMGPVKHQDELNKIHNPLDPNVLMRC